MSARTSSTPHARTASSRAVSCAPSEEEDVDARAVLENGPQMVDAVETLGLGNLRCEVADLHDLARGRGNGIADLGTAAPAARS